MAQVLPNVLTPVFLVRTQGTASPMTQTVTISPSQTIRRGDFLVKNATALTNTFEQALAAPSAGNTTTSAGSLPLALIAAEPIVTNASGVEASTGRTSIQAYVLGPQVRFGLRIVGASADASEPRDIALGKEYYLARITTASGQTGYALSATQNAAGELIPVEVYEGSSNTDKYGVMWCRISASESIQGL